MNALKQIKPFGIVMVVATVAVLSACNSPENSPGYEYAPDMYRSPAIEAYVDYGMDPYHFTTDSAEKQRNRPSAMLPPEGTVKFSPDAEKAMFNMPYKYSNTAEGYEAAGANLKNPLPLTKANFMHGKELYGKFCTHCHGEKGQGDGKVVESGHAPPTPYDGPQLKNLPEGKIFHVITYGKNMMGAHAQQVNQEERWKLVHYVQSLQSGVTPDFPDDDAKLYFSANTDTDGDGVMDSMDKCPEHKGPAEHGGCPTVEADVDAAMAAAAKGVLFDTGSWQLQDRSFTVLDKVAELMAANENFKLLINGHTDNTGNSAGNQQLSFSRAHSAKKYLVEKGVDDARVMDFGYGDLKPVADNATEEGRTQNRRVEFNIVY